MYGVLLLVGNDFFSTQKVFFVFPRYDHFTRSRGIPFTLTFFKNHSHFFHILSWFSILFPICYLFSLHKLFLPCGSLVHFLPCFLKGHKFYIHSPLSMRFFETTYFFQIFAYIWLIYHLKTYYMHIIKWLVQGDILLTNSN